MGKKSKKKSGSSDDTANPAPEQTEAGGSDPAAEPQPDVDKVPQQAAGVGEEEEGKKKKRRSKKKKQDPDESKEEQENKQEDRGDEGNEAGEEDEKKKRKKKKKKADEEDVEEKQEEQVPKETTKAPEDEKRKHKKKKHKKNKDVDDKTNEEIKTEQQQPQENTTTKETVEDNIRKEKKKRKKEKKQKTEDDIDALLAPTNDVKKEDNSKENIKKSSKPKGPEENVLKEQSPKKDPKSKSKTSKTKVHNKAPDVSSAVKEDTEYPPLNDRQNEHMLEMASIFSHLKHTAQKHNDVINDNNKTLSTVEDTLMNVEKTLGTSRLVWRIRDFKRRFVEARKGVNKAIFSPAIESHRYGYKMALSLCPNGDGKGLGSHMSLFFSILRGNYDELLPWPFTCNVTFVLCDQTQDKKRPPNHISATFYPNSAPQNDTFLGQPTGARNPSLGLPTFAPLADVWGSGENYVVDDTIFIRVEVDISTLVP